MKVVRVYFNGRPVDPAIAGVQRRLDASDFAALTGREPKLSRIPPAHWRNVYEYLDPAWVDVAASLLDGCEELAPGFWRGGTRFLSQEMAEQKGCEWTAAYNRHAGHRVVRFLRAEKFKGEAP